MKHRKDQLHFESTGLALHPNREWAELCTEEATRFTNVLHRVVGEGDTSYTASSSTMAVAHSLLAARSRSEFPVRLHRILNEFIGRPSSTFHMPLDSAVSDALGRVARDEYENEDPQSVFPVGASRSGLSILTYRFLKRTRYIDTVISLIADGLDEFFKVVMRSEPGFREILPVGAAPEETYDLQALLDLAPVKTTGDVLASADRGLSSELAWALLQVSRHCLYSSCPDLRTMPQPIFPVAMSLEYANSVATAFRRLAVEVPLALGSVENLLAQMEERGLPEIEVPDRVAFAGALLEHAAKLAPGRSLLNADITVWRTLAKGRFAAEVGLPVDLDLRKTVLAELRERAGEADDALSKHYTLRVAFLESDYRHVVRLAKDIRKNWPSEYPGHMHFFAAWKLWTSAVKEKDRRRARGRWKALHVLFPLFCRTELPLHRWFIKHAEAYARDCEEEGDDFLIGPLIRRAYEAAPLWMEGFRVQARQADISVNGQVRVHSG